MGVDLQALLAGLGGGARAAGGAIADIGEKRQRQQQLDLQQQNLAGARAMAIAKQKMDEENQQRDDALKGIRVGQAPDNQAITHAMDAGGAMGGQFGLAGVAAMKAADPTVNAPDRFQQVTPNAYIDHTATPEAIAMRKAAEGDTIRRAREAADHVRKVQAMIGAPLPNGQKITPQLAEAMIASPQLGASFTRPAEAPKPEPNQIVQGNGPDGAPKFFRVPKNGGDATEIGGITPKINGGIGGTPQAQLQQGRMLAAVSEARLADERMRAYEDKLLGGTEHISPMSQMAGNLTANLAGSHEVLGAGIQSLSEGGLNMTNPSYAQYLRDASTIGRAEQMIMPKGGTETMVRANALLARAGTGANKATIDASRMARQALFGKAGGLAQSMEPGQVQKLEAGIDKIKTGHVDNGTAPQGDALQSRAKELKAMGLTKEAARVQLQHEGLLP